MKKHKRRIILCLAIITTVCAVFFAFQVISYFSALMAFRREEASLPNICPFDAHWLEINPDYVGLLEIRGTTIRFPVVRGQDNVKYLTTTFHGSENIVGAIFMDYRNTLESPHILIYGHEVRGNNLGYFMFSELHSFREPEFMAAHPNILLMSNGKLLEFEIFSARLTDIHDPAYNLHFSTEGSFETFLERNGSPPTTQVITLSTCDGVDNDRRMIVQGALIRTASVTTEPCEINGWVFTVE
jgi:SrtB family sortase